MSIVRGLFGSGAFEVDERPKSWRAGISKLYPNGTAPLTAMLSKMKSEKVTDAEFYWWTKALPLQGGAVTGVYTNSGLSTAYVSGGVKGATLYIKIAEALSSEFRIGHQVLLRCSTDLTADVVAKVTAVTPAGASSYLTVKLLEADDNSVTKDLSDCNYVQIVGNINAEGAGMPSAISYPATKFYNFTQIFRTPLSITRTARKTTVRTAEKYAEMKKEALELHSIEMEKAFLYGIKTEETGDNGQPERTTMGIIPFIIQNGGLVDNYVSTSAVAASTSWLNGGMDWIDSCLETLFRQGSTERIGFCGSGAISAINKLCRTKGDWTFTPTTGAFGIKVMEWVTPFGTLYLKTHPLFSQNTLERNTTVVIDPGDLIYKYIDDTTFFADGEKQNTGPTRLDGTWEEYLTEAGLEIHFPQNFAVLRGFGSAHA